MFINIIPSEDRNDGLLFSGPTNCGKQQQQQQKPVKVLPFKIFSSLNPTGKTLLTFILKSACQGK